jgi:hypothetical protein
MSTSALSLAAIGLLRHHHREHGLCSFFFLLANLQFTLQLSNKQICYKETLVRSNHPMMILLCILYANMRLVFVHCREVQP